MTPKVGQLSIKSRNCCFLLKKGPTDNNYQFLISLSLILKKQIFSYCLVSQEKKCFENVSFEENAGIPLKRHNYGKTWSTNMY